jgi:hypothetical protein
MAVEWRHADHLWPPVLPGVEERAKRSFGVTELLGDARWMTPDSTLLTLRRGSRFLPHYEIRRTLGWAKEETGCLGPGDYIGAAMAVGFVRVLSTPDGTDAQLEWSRPLTMAQRRAIGSLARHLTFLDVEVVAPGMSREGARIVYSGRTESPNRLSVSALLRDADRAARLEEQRASPRTGAARTERDLGLLGR